MQINCYRCRRRHCVVFGRRRSEQWHTRHRLHRFYWRSLTRTSWQISCRRTARVLFSYHDHSRRRASSTACIQACKQFVCRVLIYSIQWVTF